MSANHAIWTAVEDQCRWMVELEALLRRRFQGRIRHLELTLEDGNLVLRGLATTYYAKQLAQQLLLQETQAIAIRNAIVVT